MNLPSATINVRLTPRASREAIGAWVGDVLQVRVTEPPVEGRANRALCRVLAKRLGIAQGRVEVLRGESARTKVVRIEGLGVDEVRRLLSGASG